MPSKNQVVIVRDLKANVPVTIEVGCEFVFVERARSLTIIAETSRMTGRRSGDTMRFDTPIEAITIESTVEQRVELILGFGSFKRLIIDGKLSIDERIETNALNTSQLPNTIVKKIGLESEEGASFGAGTRLKVMTPSDHDTATHGFINGVVYAANRFWAFSRSRIYSFDENGNILSTVDRRGDSFGDASSAVRGAVTDERGRVYVIHSEGISKIDLHKGTSERVFTGEKSKFMHLGAACENGKIYINQGTTPRRLYVYDIKNKAFYQSPAISGSIGGGATLWYSHILKKLMFSALGSGGHYPVSTGDWKAGEMVYLPPTQCQAVQGERHNRTASTWNGSVYVYANKAVDYFCQLWIQDGDNEATKKTYYISGDYEFYPHTAGVILKGEIVKAILQGLTAQGENGLNYLDYVVSLQYSDGYNTISKNGGTASWAYRGFVDDGELFLASEITLKLMPEYLTNAV